MPAELLIVNLHADQGGDISFHLAQKVIKLNNGKSQRHKKCIAIESKLEYSIAIHY